MLLIWDKKNCFSSQKCPFKLKFHPCGLKWVQYLHKGPNLSAWLGISTPKRHLSLKQTSETATILFTEEIVLSLKFGLRGFILRTNRTILDPPLRANAICNQPLRTFCTFQQKQICTQYLGCSFEFQWSIKLKIGVTSKFIPVG